MQTAAPIDSRSQNRFDVRVPVGITWEDNGTTRKTSGFTENISVNGVFVFCDEQIPVQTRVFMVISLRSEGIGPKVKIHATGKVIRHFDGGMGITQYRYKVKGRPTAESIAVH